MITKILTLISIISINLFFAQKEVLDGYPYGQDFYAGGKNELEKEMVRIVKEQKLLPCENNEEQYFVQILVNEDSSINYVKDMDSLNINKNKCAFDFSRKIFPHLKRWIPAKENGKYVSAITLVQINPFYLYHSKDDPKKNEMKNPTYKKGMNAFMEESRKIFEQTIRRNEDRKGDITFTVNEKGEMENIIISGDFSENDKKNIINSFSRIKGQWNPATFNNIPVKTKLRQPIVQNFDIQMEVEDEMKQSMYQNMRNNRYR